MTVGSCRTLRGVRFPFFASPSRVPRAARISIAFAVVVVLALASFALFGPTGTGKVPATRPSLDPTTAPKPSGGPFVVYQSSGEVFLVDVSADQMKPKALDLQMNNYSLPLTGGGDLLALPTGDNMISLVGRTGARKGAFRVTSLIRALAVSPDRRSLAIATTDEAGMSARITLLRTDGSGKARHLAAFRTTSDTSGGTFALFWSAADRLTIIDACHCDGGPGSATTYTLPLSGPLTRLSFLKDYAPYTPGPQLNGPRFVFDHVPPIDCLETPDPCGNLLHSLVVADVAKGSLRTVAERRKRAFGAPQISPDGSLVAAGTPDATPADNELTIWDVERGAIVDRVRHGSERLTPTAWIDNSWIVAYSTSGDDDLTGSLWAIHREGRGRVKVRLLISGPEITFLGWLR